MRIIRNGQDLSGKGIRESEQTLTEILPNLNKDLLSTAIILSQGMPNKFSAFSPSGRKELLERLTRSDFMIEDVKQKIALRLKQLEQELRREEDTILVNQAKITQNKTLADTIRESLKQAVIDHTQSILQLSEDKNNLQQNLRQLQQEEKEAQIKFEKINEQLLQAITKKATENSLELENYLQKYNEVSAILAEQTAELKAKQAEKTKLEAISDICPTCGQKLAGVQKPDTTALKNQISQLEKNVKKLQQEDLTSIQAKHKQYLAEIDQRYDTTIRNLKDASAEKQKNKLNKEKQIYSVTTQVSQIESKIASLQYEQTTAKIIKLNYSSS